MIQAFTLLAGLILGFGAFGPAGAEATHSSTARTSPILVSSRAVSTALVAPARQEAAEGFCESPRVRQDVKDLSAEEKARLVAAIHGLKATPSPYDPRYTYYDQFVRWHQLAVVVSKAQGGGGIAHHNPAFPPWHRKLLWLYENGLCEVSGDPSLALPYWDWTDPASTAAVFSVDFMGPGGRAKDGYAVTEGPFNRDVWQLNILPYDPATRAMTHEKYLVRALGIDTGESYRVLLPTIVEVNDTLQVPTFDTNPWGVNSNGSFRNTLEGFVIDPATGKMDPDRQTMHNIVHDWVGGIFRRATGPDQFIISQGTMEPLDVSPNDPIFFLHHANVDRIWASWQQRYPGVDNYAPQGGEARCPFDTDDPGPGQSFPPVVDREHVMMTAHDVDEEPVPGMRLDDWMYPFCLARYQSTAVFGDLTPRSQVDLEALGYRYQEYYALPPAPSR